MQIDHHSGKARSMCCFLFNAHSALDISVSAAETTLFK